MPRAELRENLRARTGRALSMRWANSCVTFMAAMAAGYPLGSFSAARLDVEEAEGAEVGFTRPVEGLANVGTSAQPNEFLSKTRSSRR